MCAKRKIHFKRRSHIFAQRIIATELKPLLQTIDGFISIERFASMAVEGKILSLSFWRDEQAVKQWRNLEAHRAAQTKGRGKIFDDYRIRIAEVARDYAMNERDEAPKDSTDWHH
ncbi:MAG: antibiotic biosynthesis monooxygenase [Hyphomicrobiales bacterium]|nr:MAG: antibiotic biosynthesis monooxygenase [Hyphomicrobiales bacterium]